MRGPHVTVRGNAKKYYCSPYGSRALSGRERRWKGGESFLEKGGAPTFSPPFHRPPFPPSSKTFDLIESLFPVLRKTKTACCYSPASRSFVLTRCPAGTSVTRPPHQLKVFEEEGEGFGEREGKLSPESFPSLSPCSLNSPSSHLHPCAACRRTWRRPPTGKARCSRLHHWGKPLCRCLRTWKGRPARGTTARA